MTVSFIDPVGPIGNTTEPISFTFTEGIDELVVGVIYQPSGVGELIYIDGRFTFNFRKSTIVGNTLTIRRLTRWPRDFDIKVREGTLAITYTPINYTATDPTSADDHFEGIDNALGALQGDVGDAQADATQALADAASALSAANTHASRHIRGGADEIDGDLLDVDFAPTNYTKTVAPTSSHVDHAASHLYGIDLALATEFRINEQSGTTYTLVAGDFDGRTELRCTHASGCTVTVPSGLSVTAWRPLVIVQVGAGQVTLLESSTTIRRTDTLKTREQWSPVVLVSTSTANTYELRGDTESA